MFCLVKHICSDYLRLVAGGYLHATLSAGSSYVQFPSIDRRRFTTHTHTHTHTLVVRIVVLVVPSGVAAAIAGAAKLELDPSQVRDHIVRRSVDHINLLLIAPPPPRRCQRRQGGSASNAAALADVCRKALGGVLTTLAPGAAVSLPHGWCFFMRRRRH
jgi:hypothetical protein